MTDHILKELWAIKDNLSKVATYLSKRMRMEAILKFKYNHEAGILHRDQSLPI